MANSITGTLTGGLLDPGTPNYAGAANKANKQTQAQIDAGLQALNATYFGGSYPMYSQVGAYAPNSTYYSIGGGGSYNPTVSTGAANPKTGKIRGKFIKGSNPTGGGANGSPGIIGLSPGGGAIGLLTGSSGPTPGGYLKHGRLFSKTDSGYQKGYGSDFYQGIQNDYIQAALPQLAQQQKSTGDSIKYGLFNRGLGTGSSAYGTAMSDLNQATGTAEQQVSDNALSAARSTQQNVMNAYQNAVSQLYNTSNPGQAAQSSIKTASQFSVPQTFTPISNMFSGLANDYATRLLYNQPSTGGGVTPYMNPGQGSGFLGPTTY